jgi:RNA polymerase sigma-70 factor (ECF subfamily)
MLEEKVLVWRFNRGDKAALVRIYERYKDDLLKVAAALLNDRSAIEDVVHDVFVGFAEASGSFTLSGSLKGYLAICVANQARDRNRADQRQQTGEPVHTRPGSAGPDEAAIRSEVAERIEAAMGQLPHEQREVIILHLQSKMTFREIAGSKDVSINTIMSRYRYGLDKLRSILDGQLHT